MSLTPTRVYHVEGTDKPRAVLAIPPRSILSDELRLARLEQYLEAEFPDLNFVMATENLHSLDEPAAGVMPAKDGTPRLSPEESQAVLGKVVDAIAFFTAYGQRLH